MGIEQFATDFIMLFQHASTPTLQHSFNGLGYYKLKQLILRTFEHIHTY